MKKKILWLLLLAVCVVIFPLTAKETKAETEGDWEFSYRYGSGVLIDSYNGTDENVVVPEKLGGEDVVAILNNAFSGNKTVKTVKLPSTVTEIRYEAFSGCTSLSEITIPSSVTDIGKEAFAGTKWLSDKQKANPYVVINGILIDMSKAGTNLNIPATVKEISCNVPKDVVSVTIPSSMTEIDTDMFADCTSLKKITIPSSVTDIGAEAFSGCTSLTEITIPSSVIHIRWKAFLGCTSLTEITIPSSVIDIEKETFSGCTSLSKITIPSSVTNIGEEAFAGTKWLSDKQKENPYVVINGILIDMSKAGTNLNIPATVKEISCDIPKNVVSVTLPSSITEIYSNMFADCISLKKVTIPSSVKWIEHEAFSGCTSLTEITIPSSVTSIGYEAFSGCTSLSEITIPSSVTNIGKDAFAGTKWLSDKQKANPYVVINGILIDMSKAGTNLNISATVKEISCDIPKNVVSVTLPSSITQIYSNMFANCTSLKKITIPSSVTEIEYGAFSGCTSLKKITIPSSVTSIGDEAFSRCTSLETIEIPETVETMKISYFSGTKWLENNLVDGKYLIVNNILYDTQNLNDDVVIPEGVRKIKTEFPTSIHSISFPASVEEIVEKIMYGSPWNSYHQVNLYEISVDSDNKNYSSYDGCLYSKDKKTLYWCPRLKESVSVYPETTQIADHAFSYCDKLKSVDIKKVTQLEWATFYNCSELTTITVPDNFEGMKDFVFEGCNKFTTIKLSGNSGKDIIYKGCLYNKDKTKLIMVPVAKTDFKIEDFVVEIGYGAVAFNMTQDIVTIPKSVNTIGDLAFFGSKINLKFIYDLPENVEHRSFYSEGDLYFVPSSKWAEHVVNPDGTYEGGVLLYYYLAETSGREYMKFNTPGSGARLIFDGLFIARDGNLYYFKDSMLDKTFNGTASYDGISYTVKAGKAVGLASIPKLSSASNITSGIQLKWSKVAGATGYILYRKTGTGSWSRIADIKNGSTVSYIDKTAKSGTTYTYTIRAYSGKYMSDWKTTKTIKRLADPTVSSASNITAGVQVKWSKVTGATGYIVYRKTGKGSWSRVADIKSGSTVSYTDKTAKSGTTYTYTVRAYSGSTMGDWSSTKTIKRLADPTVSATSNITAGVQVKWSKVAGATGYIVYRKTGKGSWSRVADIKSGSTVSYTDKTAKSGTTYTYTVRAYSGSIMGDWSSTKTVKRLADPTVSSASNITAGVQVKWTKVTGATGYIVYRKTGTGSWSRIATIKSGSTTSYIDKSAKSGTNYSYTVRACNGSTMSDWHNYKTVKRLSNPAVTSASKTSNGINVKWSKVTGATGYVVYRKTAKGSWSRIANIKSGSTTSYTDTKASRGVTYTYTVRAYNGSTMSSFNSTKSAKR